MSAPSPWQFDGLRLGFYDVIVAKPAWPFELRSEEGEKGSYAAEHGALSLDQIKALRVGELARMPSLLLLCTISTMLPRALEVMAAWGFVFKSELVVRKVTRSGKVRMGRGYRVRECHQSVLLGVLGSPRHKPFRSLFDGTVRRRGANPDELYEQVERCVPNGWYADLFATRSRPGWDTWGFEAGKFEPVVSTGAPAPAIAAAAPRDADVIPLFPERAA